VIAPVTVARAWERLRAERRAARALARACAGRGLVIAGPWLGDVGDEVLYWVPFLHRVADRYGVPPERLVAVSRGGAEALYDGLAARYVDLLDLAVPAAPGAREVEEVEEREVLERVRSRLGAPGARACGAGIMYGLFEGFWRGACALEQLLQHTDFRRVCAVRPPTPAGLPQEYAVVSLWTGPELPDAPDNCRVLGALAARLAARMPVVALGAPRPTRERRDVPIDEAMNPKPWWPRLEPRARLTEQISIIAGATLFLGTCGGLAWLAPLLGVATVAIHGEPRRLGPHLYAARHAYRRRGAARFTALPVGALRAIGVGDGAGALIDDAASAG